MATGQTNRVRPQIGSIEGVKDPVVATRLREIKAILEMITGRTPNKAQIQPLGADALFQGVVAKVNEIIDQIQK